MSNALAVNKDKAADILTMLVNLTSVQEVMVIGSVARKGQGNDLDVVLVVDHYTYDRYLVEMTKEVYGGDDSYADFADTRLDAAAAALKLSAFEVAVLRRIRVLDVQVMPTGWENHTAELQQHLPHSDANFVANIAADARRVTVHDAGDFRVALSWRTKVLADR